MSKKLKYPSQRMKTNALTFPDKPTIPDKPLVSDDKEFITGKSVSEVISKWQTKAKAKHRSLGDVGPYQEELARVHREMGVIKHNVWWSDKAMSYSEEDRARITLDTLWAQNRGHVHGQDHFKCLWWHVHCKIFRTFAGYRRWRDITLLRLDPYDVRKDGLL